MAPRLWKSVLPVALLATGAMQAAAQERPADLTEVPRVPTDYTPGKTAWGDWDFTGTWPTERITEGRILFQRPSQYGDRAWVTDEEFARRIEAAKASDGNFAPAAETGIATAGTAGLEDWFRSSSMGKRTSLLVEPRNGQLPPMTPEGKRLFEQGRSGWVPGQAYDWVDDFDTWDRCITRGFPASMFPNRYNGGIQVFQSPGYFTILNEMLGRRIVPIVSAAEAKAGHWPAQVEAWMGNSRGWWEGTTLVIETSNIKSGDSVAHDPAKRSAAPVIVTMIGGAPFNTIPMSDKTRVVERLTMTGPGTIVHELTYEDPATFTAPWTARTEWTRNEDHELYEYACHEGNYALPNYIKASRAYRRNLAAGIVEAITPETDDRSRFVNQFDWDPGLGPRPAPSRP